MLIDYIDNLMAKAKYEILEDDNSYYGEIPGVRGVWADEKSLKACQETLREVLEEWVLIKFSRILKQAGVSKEEFAKN